MKECEICNQREATEVINLGLDVGYHFGEYGKGDYEQFKVNPICISVTSINTCFYCKSKLKENRYFNINVIDKLKEFVKQDFIKFMIIEGLKD